ncbi:MAG: TatD family hydrolase [Undibacterium sp.]|nr:TatD family hydrolase [Opitutaceae bacterium]
MYFDAHNHLASPSLAPHLPAILAAYAAAGITHAVVNGTEEFDWPTVAALTSAYTGSDSVSASASRLPPEACRLLSSYGLHPWDVGNRSPAWLETLRAHLTADPHAAVGEIGLDRWMLDRARPDDPRLAGLRRAPLEEQLEVFKPQLALAVTLDRPATIHCIDAFGLLLETLRSVPLPPRGFLLHAYSGSFELVAPFAALGAYFSFNAAYLASRHTRLRELYQKIPLDRLLVETDAPAMLPPPAHAPFSFSAAPALNHPANLAASYAALATLRSLPLPDLTAIIAANSHRLFLKG